MSFDVTLIPIPIFNALLNGAELCRATRIWLEQRGICDCGAMVTKLPIWLKNERAVCEACRRGKVADAPILEEAAT